jgi:flavin reductase ActVB
MMHAPPSQVRALCPNGVTIIATFDDNGSPRGFTASSFSWLSLRPPRVAFLLARNASSHPAFATAVGFSVNVLRAEHETLAVRFAAKGADKFCGGEFAYADDNYPQLTDALATLQCRVSERADCGDHMLVLGEVVDARVTPDAVPMIQYDNAFWPINRVTRSSTVGSRKSRPHSARLSGLLRRSRGKSGRMTSGSATTQGMES